MPTRDHQGLVAALVELVEFSKKIGVKETNQEVKALEELISQMHVGIRLPPDTIYDCRSKLAGLVETILYDESGTRKTGKGKSLNKFSLILDQIDDGIYPPKFIEKELDASGFKGGSKVSDPLVRYMGSKSDVRRIFEHSVSLVGTYSVAIISGDMEKAYSLTSSELQRVQTITQFTACYESAARKYGGRPTAYEVERLGWIFPDEEARNNKEVGRIVWPKLIPVSIRRSTVHGFWVRDNIAKNGCHGSHWIVESANGFRIAKFDFFVQ